ncbi:hypothetical protein GBF38_004971, partial [Nibea albiflora]
SVISAGSVGLISTLYYHTSSAVGLELAFGIYAMYELKCKKAELVRENEKLQKELLNKDREVMEVKSELEDQKGRLEVLLEEVERDKEINQRKLQTVEKEMTEKEMAFDKPEELLIEKENLLREQWKLLAGIHEVSSGVMLDCRSKGWYPEPELFWLDGEGNLLSAGPTETVRGPDDLYTVSRRLTVRKSDSFTCRVQQKNITQTRETHFYVPEWKMMPCLNKKKDREKTITSEQTEAGGSGQLLMTDSRKMEDLEKMRLKLNEELQKKEEEQKYIVQIIETLKELAKGLEEQKEKLTAEISATENQVEENERKLKLVDEEGTEKKGDKTVKGNTKLREIIMETKWRLNERKKEHQQLQINTEKLMKRTMDDVKRIEERKNKVENDMQQIRKQIEETERGHPEKTDSTHFI